MATEKSIMAVIRAAKLSFRSKHDKVAFVVHASFLASGYVLTATGTQAFSDSALSSSSADEVGIDGWNEVDGEYAFVYANPEKNFSKVLVKCLAMNDKLLVDALADGCSELLHFEINVGHYVGENGDGNYSAQFKNLDKLVKSLDLEILSKLDGSSKPGSSTSSTNPKSSKTNEGTRTYVIEPGARVPESIGVPVHPLGVLYPPVNPVGGSDLFPGPSVGMGDFGSGSMLLGPNDPRWICGVGEHGFPGAKPGVPPSARFDPYGPPGVPGFEPGRFTRIVRGSVELTYSGPRLRCGVPARVLRWFPL